MYRSYKEFNGYSTAFRQHKADSHCRFIHGYALRFKVWFDGELDHRNWVVDFGSLKQIKRSLENDFDHKTCIAGDDFQINIFKKLEEDGIIQLRIFENGVGIEKFPEYVFNKVNTFIRNQTNERCWVVKCEIWEHNANSGVCKR